ncbi:MAG: Trk family potassium uptake protein, partial [Firmicutes bacterium]|nr:Trk family potassium uptake protein [Bacillota bacterium]
MKAILKKPKSSAYPQMIALGYLILIITGTTLLSLPIASRNGISPGFINALFTATSATCVTGLVVFDTFTNWSLFGQTVILL